MPLWVQKDFGDWTTYGGGGYWINPGPGNKNFWFAGWVLERKITDKLTLGVALFHQTPDAISGVSATGFNFGSVPSTGFMRNLRFHIISFFRLEKVSSTPRRRTNFLGISGSK
ncbi:MAG: hypothetical protein WCC90_06850 [Methylocella sp.]